MIIKNAEPFFFPGNTTGCLLIHGFSASPTEMQPLGDFLARKGYTVLGIRLAGHGTRMSDFQRMHWQDWYMSVLDGWHLLKSSTKKHFIIGLSTGGSLALYHASRYQVQGVVGLSTLYQLGPDPRLPILPILAKVIPYLPKGESDWHDPNAGKDRIAYKKYSTRALLELNRFLKIMRTSLPIINTPTLLIHSKGDKAIAPENMPSIYRNLGTQEIDKEMIWLTNSGHIVTKDLDQMKVFNAIHDFIDKIQDSG